MIKEVLVIVAVIKKVSAIMGIGIFVMMMIVEIVEEMLVMMVVMGPININKLNAIIHQIGTTEFNLHLQAYFHDASLMGSHIIVNPFQILNINFTG